MARLASSCTSSAAGAGVAASVAGSSLEAARDWLEALERRPGRDRILLCLDEFERLEEVVEEKPETKPQLVQLMGLLRATIQHRRRVRLLIETSLISV